MARVWLGRSELAMHLALLPPVLVPRLGTCQEFIVIDSAIFRPDTAGRAKVGDAALGADAGAGQHNGRAGRGQPAGNVRNFTLSKCHVELLTAKTHTSRRSKRLAIQLCHKSIRLSEITNFK